MDLAATSYSKHCETLKPFQCNIIIIINIWDDKGDQKDYGIQGELARPALMIAHMFKMIKMSKMIKTIKMRMSRLVLTELVCWQLHRLLLALQPPPVIYRLVYSVSDPQIQIHKQRDTNTQIHGYKHLLRCGDCPGGHLTLESIMMET